MTDAPNRAVQGPRAVKADRGGAAIGGNVTKSAIAVGENARATVYFGGSGLHLTRLHLQKRAPRTIVELLRADLQATTLVGRKGQLSMLATWRDGDEAIAVRCLIGRAGAGKTRLAVEACAEAEGAGWDAGFVSSEELRRFYNNRDPVQWRPGKDALIVVDYAASSLQVLKPWFAELARLDLSPRGPRLRILLLERHADAHMGWWSELKRDGSLSQSDAADLLEGEDPHALATLVEVEDRRALLAETMRLAAPLLDPPTTVVSPPPAAGVDAEFDRRLENPAIENEPLYLLMTGVHAVSVGASAALALRRGELAARIASVERTRLERFAAQRGFTDGGILLGHLAACVTLQNGCALEACTKLVDEEAQALGLDASRGGEGVAWVLCDVLPNAQGKLDAIRPDLIGEAFLLESIQGSPLRSDDVRLSIVLRAYHRDPLGVVETLIRCARDHAEGHTDHAAVNWLAEIVRQTASIEALALISEKIPEQTLSLREVSAVVERRLAEGLRTGVASSEAHQASFASSLNNLANRVSALGRREEALEAAQEAVALYRDLAAARPDAFIPNLAMSLNNLANVLSGLGRREEALEAVQEAVALYRDLADARPDAFTPDLAASLNNLANRLSDLGRREEALEAAQEAVALYRDLAAARPDAFTPDLARSLSVLADMLEAAGGLEAALTHDREAVERLSPYFLARARAHADLMSAIVRDYVRRVEAAGEVPDAELLRPILRSLSELPGDHGEASPS